MTIFYRGNSIRRYLDDEFADNAVSGHTYLVVEGTADLRRELDRGVMNYDSIERVPGVENVRKQPVTGGFSLNLGTGITFASRRTRQPVAATVLTRETVAAHDLNLPRLRPDQATVAKGPIRRDNLPRTLNLVMMFDSEKIPAETNVIEYRPEWFDLRPAVLPRIQVQDGVMVVPNRETGNKQAHGLFSVGADGNINITSAGRGSIERAATVHNSQQEIVAMTPEVRLDAATVGLAGYYRPDFQGRPHLPVPDADTRMKTPGQRRSLYRSATQDVWERTAELIPNAYHDRLGIVVADIPERPVISGPFEARPIIRREEFEWVYEGPRDGFTDDYDQAGVYVGGQPT